LKVDLRASSHDVEKEDIIESLPGLWVLNDEFIVSLDKQTIESVEDDPFPLSDSLDDGSEFTFEARLQKNPISVESNLYKTYLNPRETVLLHIHQALPSKSSIKHIVQLDILLEDYLEYAQVYNSNLRSDGKKLEPLPSMDPTAIMNLDMSVKLDLAAILGCSVVFDVPRKVLEEALVILLSPKMSVKEAQQLAILPRYVKTAIISLIKRIVSREKAELEMTSKLSAKPVVQRHNKKHRVIPTYSDAQGFNHLRQAKEYLAGKISADSSGSEGSAVPPLFSELQNELLAAIPEVFTEITFRQGQNSSDYTNWTSFVLRHAVLLLSRAPTCPPLTRAQTSLRDQNMYNQLLRILEAASMAYKDMDLAFSGPDVDGRLVESSAAYGDGVPNATASSLAWNQESWVSSRGQMMHSRPNPTFASGAGCRPETPHSPPIVIEGSSAEEWGPNGDAADIQIKATGILAPNLSLANKSENFIHDQPEPNLNGNSARAGTRSDTVKSVKSAFPPVSVSAFCDDREWKSSFMIAPTKKVEGAMEYYRFMKETGVNMGDVIEWEPVEKIPAIVHPHEISKTGRGQLKSALVRQIAKQRQMLAVPSTSFLDASNSTNTKASRPILKELEPELATEGSSTGLDKLAHSLMREMGSFRKEHQNSLRSSFDQKLSLSSSKHVTTQPSQSNEQAKCFNPTKNLQLSWTQLQNEAKSVMKRSRNDAKAQSMTFLTGMSDYTALEHGEEGPISLEEKHNDESKHPAVAGITANLKYPSHSYIQDSIFLSASLASTKEPKKLTSASLFLGSQGVEDAGVAAGGKVLVAPWYPCYEKSLLTLGNSNLDSIVRSDEVNATRRGKVLEDRGQMLKTLDPTENQRIRWDKTQRKKAVPPVAFPSHILVPLKKQNRDMGNTYTMTSHLRERAPLPAHALPHLRRAEKLRNESDATLKQDFIIVPSHRAERAFSIGVIDRIES
jgi:hypothetical protein